jgi:hypothetical protein
MKSEKTKNKMKKNNLFIISLNLFVLTILIISFIFLGNPVSKKREKIDNAKISDLETIGSQIGQYFSKNGELPKTLNPILIEINIKIDKENPIVYEIKSDTEYELCTTFLAETKEDPRSSRIIDKKTELGKHNKGYDCTTLKISKWNLEEGQKIKNKIISETIKTIDYSTPDSQTSNSSENSWTTEGYITTIEPSGNQTRWELSHSPKAPSHFAALSYYDEAIQITGKNNIEEFKLGDKVKVVQKNDDGRPRLISVEFLK